MGTTTIEPNRTKSATLFVFIVPPSLKVQPKLLRDPKTDVTPHGHELCACGMSNIPIHSKPKMHSRTHAHVGFGSGEQHVATAPALSEADHAFILRVQPSQGGADEPFTSYVLRLIGSVRQPEARFVVAA